MAYLCLTYAKPVHDCADCGYPLPYTWARPLSKPPRPVTAYFDSCPLCGGKVGWHPFSCNSLTEGTHTTTKVVVGPERRRRRIGRRG